MSTILATSERLKKPIGCVYVLRCAGNRFYVGFTRNLAKRTKQHFSGIGAEFTKIFRPLEVLVTIPANGEEEEYLVWTRYARKYGWRRVGGWNRQLALQFGFVWINSIRA